MPKKYSKLEKSITHARICPIEKDGKLLWEWKVYNQGNILGSGYAMSVAEAELSYRPMLEEGFSEWEQKSLF